jgi:hypothetical protein
MHKIYKIDEHGNWDRFSRVEFPDGQVLDENNKDLKKDGFFWSDEEPKEYLEWLNEQNDEVE